MSIAARLALELHFDIAGGFVEESLNIAGRRHGAFVLGIDKWYRPNCMRSHGEVRSGCDELQGSDRGFNCCISECENRLSLQEDFLGDETADTEMRATISA
jgi:hypothetical protein